MTQLGENLTWEIQPLIKAINRKNRGVLPVVDDAERPGRVQPAVEPVVPEVLKEEEGAEMEGDLSERRERE